MAQWSLRWHEQEKESLEGGMGMLGGNRHETVVPDFYAKILNCRLFCTRCWCQILDFVFLTVYNFCCKV